MIIAALFLIIVVTIVVSLGRRAGSRRIDTGGPDRSTPTSPASPTIRDDVDALLRRWTSAGLLSAAQADDIRTYETRALASEVRLEQRPRFQAIAEALGYLGGMLGLGGIVILLSRVWDDFSDLIRLGVAAGSSVVFVISGTMVREHSSAAMSRLRVFLWTLAVATSGVAAWVLAEDVFDFDQARRRWLCVGIVTAALSFSLWAGRLRPVQQALGIAGTAVALGTAIGEFASVGFCGLGVWVAAAVVLLASIRRSGQRALVNVGTTSAALVVGAFLSAADWRGPGFVFVMFTGLLLVSPAAIRRISVPAPAPMMCGIAGLIALAQGVPSTVIHFSREAGLVTGLVVWMAAVVTLVLVRRHWLRFETLLGLFAGAMFVAGAAITGVETVGFATVFGLVTAIALIAIGTRPGWATMSVFGLVGLLVFIPWSIGHFFPGEGRVPLLVIVSGLVLVGVAVAMTRLGGRLRGEMRASH